MMPRMSRVALTLLLLTGSVSSLENISCTQQLQLILSNITKDYRAEDNSLSLKWEEKREVIGSCGTSNFSIELWRAIKTPSAQVPQDFGTREYFSKFQNCDSPNPDLLWKHGDSIHASVNEESREMNTSWLKEKIAFYHVVEKQYMLRICPCTNINLPCTCEHAGQSVAVCSEILNISNTGEDQVFAWCKGKAHQSPTPLIGVPVLQHCPAKERFHTFIITSGQDCSYIVRLRDAAKKILFLVVRPL